MSERAVSTRFRQREMREWISDAIADPRLLADLVEHLRATEPDYRSKLDYAKISKAMNGSASRFANYKGKKIKTALDQQEIGGAVAYLVKCYPGLERGGADSSAGSPTLLTVVAGRLYDFLNVSPRNRQRWPNRLGGLYWVYRPSLIAPGMYLRGLLAIWYVGDRNSEGLADADRSGMVRVCEVHRHPGGSGLDARNDGPLLIEAYDGFAIAKKGSVFLFMSERFDSAERGPLLVVRMHGFLPNDQQRPLLMAWGRAPGASDSGHAPPVVLERVSPNISRPEELEAAVSSLRSSDAIAPSAIKPLIEKCKIMKASEVPDLVLARMDAMNREAWSLADQFLRRDAEREE